MDSGRGEASAGAPDDMCAYNRVFVRSVMNFVVDDEWFCSIFNLNMGD